MKSRLLIAALFAVTLCAAQKPQPLNLIPQPASVERGEGYFTLTPTTVISTTDYTDLAQYLNTHLQNASKGILLAVGPEARSIDRISLRTAKELPTEGYTLQITPEGIDIAACDRRGIFYGLQTLFQLMPPAVYAQTPATQNLPILLPAVTIKDAPRYGHREVMLDVSRTFFDKQTVMRYIDWAARHKINVFHWHLTDDNGWRIEIKKYPRLTERGAWRGPGEALPASYGSGGRRYGGYYTQDDIREVVRYAAFRNVEVIPEINLPGHSQAVTASYPETFCQTPSPLLPEDPRNVWCAGREENFTTLKDILTEVAALFPSRYIHIGGDEVSYSYWRNCPRCQALMQSKGLKTVQNLQNYFVKRLETIVYDLGKEPAAWNEAIKGGNLRRSTVIYGWQGMAACEEAVRQGQRVVMMPGSYLYIDMKQHAFDRGHTWAGLVDTRRVYSFDPTMADIPADKMDHILGVAAGQWAELLDRPERFMEYQAYPRLAALAEVGWSDKSRRDWDDFYARLTGGHLDRLAAMGIQFRMFPPEVNYAKGIITAIPPTPKTEIRYTTDFSEPTVNSPLYTAPIRDLYPEDYRFRAFYKGGYSTALPPTAKFTRTVTPRAKETYTLPLADYVDRDGLWLLTVTPEDDNLTINQLRISGLAAPYDIIRNGQRVNPFSTIRLYITEEMRRGGRLDITFSNSTVRPNKIEMGFAPSAYIEPKVTVTSSLGGLSRFPLAQITDYNFTSYARTSRPCTKGDYLLYTFQEPVDCHLIDVRTGIPNVTRYIITQGEVEYSADGVNFRRATVLDDNGNAVIYPESAVKAVRIVIGGSNGEPLAAFQDLRIVPKM